MGGLEVDGGDGLVVFEDVVSAFEVGLVAVRGEDFGVGEGGVVGDERETAVGGGVVGNAWFVDNEPDLVVGGDDFAVAGVRAGSAPVLLFVFGGGVLGDRVVDPPAGTGLFQRCVGGGLDGNQGFHPGFG